MSVSEKRLPDVHLIFGQPQPMQIIGAAVKPAGAAQTTHAASRKLGARPPEPPAPGGHARDTRRREDTIAHTRDDLGCDGAVLPLDVMTLRPRQL